ncbi:MAG: FtsX-like permease family protein [Paracoccaceae bacterium]|nr:FtsX-like permease family protein [Paracoccaceae bacterium]
MPFWVSLALRELRGGLAGFRVFLACLILGVGGIAVVGSMTAAIERGLAAEGRQILGGDASLSFTYRFANDNERAWIESQGQISEVADLRSMLARGDDRALAQVKGVDGVYPLYGALSLSNGGDLAPALAPTSGVYGLVTEPVLAERLGLSPGDRVELAGVPFDFRGTIAVEPDRISGGFALGPRVIALTEGLRAGGLLGPGTLFTALYRMRVEPGAKLEKIRDGFTDAFPEAGARWRDRNNAAPGLQRFVDRLGAFLTLTGLAALAIGGVGVGAAVRGYLGRKTKTIAALRAIGASAGELFAAYALQIALIGVAGIAAGLALGAGLVALAGPFLAERLPVPAEFAVYPRPLAIAGLFGALTAALFALWPLAQLREMRPALLFRDLNEGGTVRPRGGMLALLALLAATLGWAVIGLSGAPDLALWVVGAVAGAFITLRVMAWLARVAARHLAHACWLRHRPGLRLALGAIGAPGGQTGDVVLALGLGLGVLAAIGQTDANMQRLIRAQLPEGSPAFFFVDIQTDQLERFRSLITDVEGAGRIESAPMLRGVVTHLNGVPAAEAQIDPDGAWVLRGDRGVSYAAAPPPGAVITEGTWWEAGNASEPLVSFSAHEGAKLGLTLGSTITVNVLGRPVTARVANLRQIEWQGLGINFLMILNPAALAGAPHSHIATVHASPGAEAPIMRAVGRALPNVTTIRVRDQVTRVSEGLQDLGAATRWAAAALLMTGLVVLIGAAGTAAERQTGEAAILKVLGADRARILASFALRALILGALAGLVALAWGWAAAWGATRFVLDGPFVFQPGTALAVVLGGALLNLAAGLAFSLYPLRLRPARVLRRAAG